MAIPKKKNKTRACYVIEYDISKHEEDEIGSFLTHITNIDAVKKYLYMSFKKEYTKGYIFDRK